MYERKSFIIIILLIQMQANVYLSRVTGELHDALRTNGAYDSAADAAALNLSQVWDVIFFF